MYWGRIEDAIDEKRRQLAEKDIEIRDIHQLDYTYILLHNAKTGELTVKIRTLESRQQITTVSQLEEIKLGTLLLVSAIKDLVKKSPKFNQIWTTVGNPNKRQIIF